MGVHSEWRSLLVVSVGHSIVIVMLSELRCADVDVLLCVGLLCVLSLRCSSDILCRASKRAYNRKSVCVYILLETLPSTN